MRVACDKGANLHILTDKPTSKNQFAKNADRCTLNQSKNDMNIEVEINIKCVYKARKRKQKRATELINIDLWSAVRNFPIPSSSVTVTKNLAKAYTNLHCCVCAVKKEKKKEATPTQRGLYYTAFSITQMRIMIMNQTQRASLNEYNVSKDIISLFEVKPHAVSIVFVQRTQS